ncbi:MAG TPA: ABC transporter substrate-binding protein [Polyangiaceae bacterium]|nr:ABC transporter substrate-binding protein [Polyangiaceae bacterium]
MRSLPWWFLAVAPAGAALTVSGCNQISGVSDYQRVNQIIEPRCFFNAECAARRNDPTSVCRKDTGVCVKLTSEECAIEGADYQNDEAFIFASILPLTNSEGELSAGDPLRKAMRLALADFRSEAGGLPGRPGGPSPRPFVMLECNDRGNLDVARRAARHVAAAGLPAVLGPMFSGITYSVADEITIDAGIFLLSPTASTQSISALDDGNLVWRTAPTVDLQVEALARFMPIVEYDPGVRATFGLNEGDPIRVATVSKGDAFGAGLAAGLRSQLTFNNRPATNLENDRYFSGVRYGDPARQDVTADDYEAAVDVLVTARPHVVFLLGVDEINTEVLPRLEAKWGDGAPRPIYLSASGPYAPSLFTFLEGAGAATDVRSRIFGVVPGTNNNVFGSFRRLYGDTYPGAGSEADTSGPSHSYDAVYLLGFAAVALGAQPITGANIASMMTRMVAPGAPVVEAGPGQLASTLNLLAQEGVIDFSGASGPVEFNDKGDSPVSEMQFWCIEGTNKGRYSGAFYSIDKRLVIGAGALTTLEPIRTACGL